MASGELLKQLFERLTQAKEANFPGAPAHPDPHVRGTGPRGTGGEDVPLNFDERQALNDFYTSPGQKVGNLRGQIRDNQGHDPLRTTIQEFQGSEESGRFPDQPVQRDMGGPQGRLPGQGGSGVPQGQGNPLEELAPFLADQLDFPSAAMDVVGGPIRSVGKNIVKKGVKALNKPKPKQITNKKSDPFGDVDEDAGAIIPRSIGEDFQNDFRSGTPAEKAEYRILEQAIMGVASKADGEHFDRVGQEIDSNKEFASMAIDDVFSAEGLEGLRRMYRDHVQRSLPTADDISFENSVPKNIDTPTLDDEIPF